MTTDDKLALANCVLRNEGGKIYDAVESLVYMLEMNAAQVARHEERDRCARIAEAASIPGHSVQEPTCREIAKRIREGQT